MENRRTIRGPSAKFGRETPNKVRKEINLSVNRPRRTALTNRIRDEARERALALGLDVIDVRLKQTNLPEQNLEATFARMRDEREREAADEIARGDEAAQRVRALSDRTVVELVSEARRESEITRGEADAERNGIFAEAFGRDPEFFEFYRSLTAYQRALKEGNSTMVISPDSEFFDYLQTVNPRGVPMPGSASAPIGASPEGDGAVPDEDAALDGPAEPAPAVTPGGSATELAATPGGDGEIATD
jgi:membrane protease subunit HflC